MAFDFVKQFLCYLQPSKRVEGGQVVLATAANSISGQTLTIPSKLKKVQGGFGFTVADGLICFPTIGTVSGGAVTWTRNGTILTAEDTINYILVGY